MIRGTYSKHDLGQLPVHYLSDSLLQQRQGHHMLLNRTTQLVHLIYQHMLYLLHIDR